MMVRNWNYDREYDAVSDDDPYDSDKIDSDVEAELYSVIHHQLETPVRNANQGEHLKSLTTVRISDNFNSDRISDCYLYNNFESEQNNSSQNYCKYLKGNADLINFLDGSQANTNLASKKQINMTEKTIRSSMENENTQNVNESSDSDNDIIWTEPCSTEKLFETNLSQPTIVLSSDSDSSVSSFRQSNSHKLSNESNISIRKLNEDSKGIWHVNDEDLYRFKRRARRYHDLNCNKCGQKGHFANSCSVTNSVKCYICGSRHNGARCKRRACIRCYKKGHDLKYCSETISICSCCKMIGHVTEKCPNVWRKFHLTTSEKFITSGSLKQDTPIYCYNCGKGGHFGAVCIERRMDKLSFHTWPSVINYGRNNSFGRKTNNNSRENDLQPSKSFLDRCSEKTRQRILLRKQRKIMMKSLSKAEKKSFAKDVDFPRTPKEHQKSSPNFDPHNKTTQSLSKRSRRRANAKRKLLATQIFNSQGSLQ